VVEQYPLDVDRLAIAEGPAACGAESAARLSKVELLALLGRRQVEPLLAHLLAHPDLRASRITPRQLR
jgi:hypothetical protein